ncbi:hypothetical protein M1D88_08945 [Arthrobacter sp. R1-13]
MHDSQQKEKVLRISGEGNTSFTVSLEDAEPVTVRLEIDAKCGCQGDGRAVSRPGSYIDTEVPGQKN